MSGPVVPPLEVTEVDGSPDGRPITKIIVSNGDLTISGRTATIDTSGSSTTPGGSTTQIQYNNAGAFAGDAGFVMSVVGGGSTTVTQTGNILTGGNKGVATASANGTIHVISDGTGQIILQSGSDAGGTWTDSIVNVMCNANTDDAQLKFRDNTNTDNGSITLDGSGHMILNNNVAAKDIDLKVLTTGQVEVANQTTDTVSVLSIMGNGAGDARIDMQNASERVWLVMDTNKKLKIEGGSGGDTFVFDVSSATGGIQFPDGTSLVSAEGTAILSTGETGATKFLREDGDGTCSWQAAGGGGVPATQPGRADLTSDIDYYNLAQQLWQLAVTTQADNDPGEPMYFPFVSGNSEDVENMTIVVGTGAAATTYEFGIYSSSTTTGMPDTLLGSASFDCSAAATVTETGLSITLERGTSYWYAFVRDSGSNTATFKASNIPYESGIANCYQWGTGTGTVLHDLVNTDSLPASPATTVLKPYDMKWPWLILGV